MYATRIVAELQRRDDRHRCQWCTDAFATVPELLDHVVDHHLTETHLVGASEAA